MYKIVFGILKGPKSPNRPFEHLFTHEIESEEEFKRILVKWFGYNQPVEEVWAMLVKTEDNPTTLLNQEVDMDGSQIGVRFIKPS